MAGKADVIKLRVVDTATFIEAGKRANGDLYDYSQSVFGGSSKPILIGCNRCGKLVDLKNAASHYLKGCGCKACNSDKLSPCKVCGVDVSSKVYHAQAKRCKACCDKAKQDRVTHKELKHGKNCKGCGVWFVDRDRFYCTAECRKSAVAKPVEFCCAYCGTQGFKDLHSIKNPSRIFCNPECQKQFQATRYWDYQSKGKAKHGVVSLAKSKKAKSKWESQRREERMQSSNGAKWWSKCLESKTRIYWAAERTGWEQRCGSAAVMLKKRREPVFRLERQAVHSWDRTIRNNKRRLKIDSRTKEQIEWSNKINHTVRACKRRFAARNKGDTGIFGTSTEETRRGLQLHAE